MSTSFNVAGTFFLPFFHSDYYSILVCRYSFENTSLEFYNILAHDRVGRDCRVNIFFKFVWSSASESELLL